MSFEQVLTHMPVIVSDVSFASEEPSHIVISNISFVNALMQEFILPSEIAREAILSCSVDNYLYEVNNGGHSQFFYNTEWSPNVIALLREGLEAMKADQHLSLLSDVLSVVQGIQPEELSETYEQIAALEPLDDRFYELADREDLTTMNANWLRSLPDLKVMSEDEMQAEVENQASRIADRAARMQMADSGPTLFFDVLRNTKL